jgi:glycosyltransferase involved in cell wall biosynthesis
MRGKVNSDETETRATKPGWLFVLPWSLEETGGVNHVVRSLIGCLQDSSEFEPAILITSHARGTSRVSGTRIKAHWLDVWSPVSAQHRLRSLFSFVRRWPRRFRELTKIIRMANIAVINLHFPSLNVLMFLMLRTLSRSSPKIVLSFHGSDVKNVVGSAGLERYLWRQVLRKVDYIVVVSESLARDLEELEPRISEKVVTIYNGVNLEAFVAENNQVTNRFADDAQTIVTVGTFSRVKGHDVLVHAFSLVLDKIPHCRLVLVGKRGPELGRIRDLIETLNLGPRVSIHHDVPHDQIASFFHQAQIFVLSSRREGFPLVLAEAAAARLPIVSTDVGGTGELIKDGITGRLVKSENPVLLANAITDLLTLPKEAERIAVNCHEYVKSNLTWNHAYQKYLKLLSHSTHISSESYE